MKIGFFLPLLLVAVVIFMAAYGSVEPTNDALTNASDTDITATPIPPTTAPTPATRATLSPSKIGVFFLGDAPGTPEARKLLNAGPRVIKVVPETMQIARDYKSRYTNPSGIVVMRNYAGSMSKTYDTTDNPKNAADDYFNRVIKPFTDSLSASDRAVIDYISGPNEFENLPFFIFTDTTNFGHPNSEMPAWTNKFWLELAKKIHEAGFKPLIGDITVSWPQNPSDLEPMKDALNYINRPDVEGALGYHSYTMNMAKDPNDSNAFRQVLIHNYLETIGVHNLPIILTEGGFAATTHPHPGYHARGNDAEFEDWLSWYDDQLQNEPYVLGGVTLFQIGTPDPGQFDTYDLKYIADWLANYIATK